MRRPLLVLCLLALPARTLMSQSFLATLQRADSAENRGAHAEAVKLYEEAYGLSGFDPAGLGIAARSAARGKLFDVAIRDLNRAVDQGYLEPRMLADSAFNPVRKDARWIALDAKLQRKLKAINQNLRAELVSLGEQDQANRSDFNALMKKVQQQSPEGKAAFKAFNSSDSAIQSRVKAIIKQYGWPTRSLVADDGAHAAWLVVQHMQKEDQELYLPKLLAAVKAGEAQAGEGAMLQDRVLARNKKPQIYGTQLSVPPGGGDPKPDPIEKPECVDQRRKTVGLEPLGFYLIRYGIVWKPEGKCALQ